MARSMRALRFRRPTIEARFMGLINKESTGGTRWTRFIKTKCQDPRNKHLKKITFKWFVILLYLVTLLEYSFLS
jgi:hypothetical protein